MSTCTSQRDRRFSTVWKGHFNDLVVREQKQVDSKDRNGLSCALYEGR